MDLRYLFPHCNFFNDINSSTVTSTSVPPKWASTLYPQGNFFTSHVFSSKFFQVIQLTQTLVKSSFLQMEEILMEFPSLFQMVSKMELGFLVFWMQQLQLNSKVLQHLKCLPKDGQHLLWFFPKKILILLHWKLFLFSIQCMNLILFCHWKK